MFKKLRAKWKVKGWELLLIISIFAIGGSICGYAARKILLISGLEKNFIWVLLYIVLITILWPLIVIIVSIPFGQLAFFLKYIQKIGTRIFKREVRYINKSRAKIAIFASGAGSNANKIIEFFKNNSQIKIDLIVSNKLNSGVLQIARANGIETLLVNRDQLKTVGFIKKLKKRNIELVVLAGFLLKIPPELLQAFPKKIINIHPALLPAYGGKGMYGMHVHNAVISNREKQSGISVHYADEIYDHGEIIFQATSNIEEGDTPASLSQKIQLLEHAHYPAVIENILKSKNLLNPQA